MLRSKSCPQGELGLLHADIPPGHIVIAGSTFGETSPLSPACRALAQRLAEKENVQTVVAHKKSSIGIALLIAQHLAQLQGKNLSFVSLEDIDGCLAVHPLKLDLITHKKVLIVMNTIGALKEALRACRHVSGRVVGIVTVCNKGNSTRVDANVPIHWIVNPCHARCA